MCHMKRATVRELHIQTSAIVKAVAEGELFVIEKRGVPVAELRPFEQLPSTRGLPNREALISKMRKVKDSGRILEEDRS
jgi:antitoxin (DNA-binding transcriptional repressor) of toxin-antitoxin stability system